VLVVFIDWPLDDIEDEDHPGPDHDSGGKLERRLAQQV
jgi:hypothetical protein